MPQIELISGIQNELKKILSKHSSIKKDALSSEVCVYI
jgi:hypothetical protein